MKVKCPLCGSEVFQNVEVYPKVIKFYEIAELLDSLGRNKFSKILRKSDIKEIEGQAADFEASHATVDELFHKIREKLIELGYGSRDIEEIVRYGRTMQNITPVEGAVLGLITTRAFSGKSLLLAILAFLAIFQSLKFLLSLDSVKSTVIALIFSLITIIGSIYISIEKLIFISFAGRMGVRDQEIVSNLNFKIRGTAKEDVEALRNILATKVISKVEKKE